MEDHLIGDIPYGAKKIGLAMSGGCDSSLLFYLLCKKIIDEDLGVKIYPLTLCHIDRKYISEIVHNIINLQKHLSFVSDPYVYISYYDRKYTTENLKNFLNPKKRNVDIIVRGTSKSLPENITKIPVYNDRENCDDINSDKEWVPFVSLNKYDIALIYKMYNLKELFKLTASCSNYYIDKRGIGITCKKCRACIEKKIAFKTFDNEWLL